MTRPLTAILAALLLAASANIAATAPEATVGCRSRTAAERLAELAARARPSIYAMSIERAIAGDVCRRFAPADLVETNVRGWYQARDDGTFFYVAPPWSPRLLHPLTCSGS